MNALENDIHTAVSEFVRAIMEAAARTQPDDVATLAQKLEAMTASVEEAKARLEELSRKVEAPSVAAKPAKKRRGKVARPDTLSDTIVQFLREYGSAVPMSEIVASLGLEASHLRPALRSAIDRGLVQMQGVKRMAKYLAVESRDSAEVA